MKHDTGIRAAVSYQANALTHPSQQVSVSNNSERELGKHLLKTTVFNIAKHAAGSTSQNNCEGLWLEAGAVGSNDQAPDDGFVG